MIENAKYRSLRGDFYDAAITAKNPNGTVDLEVRAPGCETPLVLTRIFLAGTPALCKPGQAYSVPASA